MEIQSPEIRNVNVHDSEGGSKVDNVLLILEKLKDQAYLFA